MRVFSSGSHRPPTRGGQTGTVARVWKGFVVALLTLSAAGYAVGALSGAPERLPDQRVPVVVGDPLRVEPTPTLRTDRPAPLPERPAGTEDTPERDDDPRGDGDLPVIRPEPRDLDDSDGDDRDDGEDDGGDDD